MWLKLNIRGLIKFIFIMSFEEKITIKQGKIIKLEYLHVKKYLDKNFFTKYIIINKKQFGKLKIIIEKYNKYRL